jgi:signal transduction histidine kinase
VPRHGSATAEEPEPAVQAPAARRGLAGWPIRRKLVTLVTGPLVLILGAGIFFTAQSVQALGAAQKASDLADVALLTNRLVGSLNIELARTMLYTPDRKLVAPARAMKDARRQTDLAYDNLKDALADPPGGHWGDDVEARRAELSDVLRRLPFVRVGVDRGNGDLVIQGGYTKQLQATLALTNALARNLATSAQDAATVDASLTLSALASATSAASLEAVRLNSALRETLLSVNTELALIELKVTHDTQLALAATHATPAQRAQISAIQLDDGRIDSFRMSALRLAQANRDRTVTQADRSQADTQARNYAAAAGQRVQALDGLVTNVTTATRDGADAKARQALLKTGLVASLALLSLLLASALVTLVARTVTVPMRRLRAGAVDAATVRLPAMVRQIERDGPDSLVGMPPVLPPGTVAGPETIEVAQAVDGLTSEAVRLATAQVRLRQALDEAFVSMSRRSQSMVEKQLAIIDELESTEEDPEQLRNLFRLDHLAARMRRYNDNLLVLAGSALRTRSAAPVPIADVFRAATSEMEQYERVRLQPVNGVSISGPVAGGLVHLLAELLDNAAMYSPPTSPILLAGSLTPDGGLHLEITDSGVGIPASELADLNARLAMPGSIDTQVPSRMGLYVVARLAQRGGFTVQLSPRAQAAGTVAEVDVPAPMVVGRSGQPIGPGGQPSQPLATNAPNAPLSPGQMLQPLRPGQPVPLGRPGSSTGPSDDSGESGRPSGRPGSPLPTRSPAATGSMRLNPALRLTTSGTAPTAPGGVGTAAAAEPGSGTAAGPAGPRAPLTPAARGDAPAGPATTPDSPSGAPALPSALRLPSRRPGAALTSTPLGAGQLADTATPSSAPAAGAPGGLPPAPRYEAPKSGGLPRRTRGSALAGTPLAGPPSGPLPLNGAAASEMFGASTTPVPAPAVPDTGAPSAVPPPVPPPVPRPGTGTAESATAAPDEDGDPTHRPVRPFAQPRPAPARPPFRPGAMGASAAAAAAAAARARTESTGRPPAPGTGLFATTGPATLPSGVVRPQISVPLGDAPIRSGAAPTGPAGPAPTGPAGQAPGGPAGPAPTGPAGPAPGGPAGPTLPRTLRRPTPRGEVPPAAATPVSATELEARAASAGRYVQADPEAPMIGVPDLDVDSPIFDSISAWFSKEPTAKPDVVIDLRDDARAAPAAEPANTPAPAPAGAASGADGNRWSALGDQQWLAANARAAAGPNVAGNTDAGLPRRQPGANLLPSATEAAPSVSNVPGTSGTMTPSVAAAAGSAGTRPDAEAVRGRLGSYQRGLTSARRARYLPGTSDPGATTTARPFGEPESRPQHAEQQPADQGGDH